MRLISRSLSVALVVGCFVAAVVVAGEPKCDGPYKGLTLTPEELATVLRNHQAWRKSGEKREDERRANLCQADLRHADLQGVRLGSANLQRADLRHADVQTADLRHANLQRANLFQANLQGADLGIMANLQGAKLIGANLQGARLDGANLQGAYLFSANLQGAKLIGANLQGARLDGANLQGANLFHANLEDTDLRGANLQGADLGEANLQGALYEPLPGALPNFWTLSRPQNKLETLVFHTSPAALIALRKAIKEGGMRTQERQLTYAIERFKRRQAWHPWWYIPDIEDPRPWLERLAGKGESLFSYVLFELPSHYGMAPRRAVWSLIGFIPLFALFYWIALHRARSRSRLWVIVPADRLTRGRGHEKVVRIRLQTAKTWRERLMGEARLFRTSLYFSLLSAFHLGWREYNVGTWIARLQPREYTLRATGWVRTVAGIQSLLSVYLLALWVLTYFGRPFE